jgi:hypothetical protein
LESRVRSRFHPPSSVNWAQHKLLCLPSLYTQQTEA